MRPAARRAGLAPALTAAVTLAFTWPGPGPGGHAVTPGAASARYTAAAAHRHPPIRHVIEITLENHTFDNLFPYRWAQSAAPGTLVPSPRDEGDVYRGIRHSRAAELKAMDYGPGKGYLMDGYTRPPFGVSAVTTFGPRFAPRLHRLARRSPAGRAGPEAGTSSCRAGTGGTSPRPAGSTPIWPMVTCPPSPSSGRGPATAKSRGRISARATCGWASL